MYFLFRLFYNNIISLPQFEKFSNKSVNKKKQEREREKNCKTHPAIGVIFSANARLMQNPAPPVANQNFTFC